MASGKGLGGCKSERAEGSHARRGARGTSQGTEGGGASQSDRGGPMNVSVGRGKHETRRAGGGGKKERVGNASWKRLRERRPATARQDPEDGAGQRHRCTGEWERERNVSDERSLLMI